MEDHVDETLRDHLFELFVSEPSFVGIFDLSEQSLCLLTDFLIAVGCRFGVDPFVFEAFKKLFVNDDISESS